MWKYKGEKIIEDNIYDIVADHYDEDDYEQLLNDLYEEVKIGNLTYAPGYVLKNVDPTAFRIGIQEEIDYIAHEIIYNPNDYPEYGIEWVDEE